MDLIFNIILVIACVYFAKISIEYHIKKLIEKIKKEDEFVNKKDFLELQKELLELKAKINKLEKEQ